MRIGKASPDLLQKIKDSVNIIEVVGEHVVLRKSGANYTGLCPFHSERTPSFSVSENKQLFHCYGCKRGGDLVTFVMDILGISFPEAIEELSERSRIMLPKDWNGAPLNPQQEEKRTAQRDKQALAFKLNRFAAAFYHQTLGNYPQAIEYLMARGVGEDWAKMFYLGASTDAWDSLANHLTSKKAPMDLAVELGLIRPSTKGPTQGTGYFDLFRNRVLFPILNLRGKVAGFGGRVLGDDTPKYLNSSESLVFQKSKLAFGLYQAQKHIREKDEIILVEGYFDVIAMHTAGFQNVVATCGTSLTSDHLMAFKRFASKVTVLFDGDKAGIAATERAMEIGLEHGLVLYGAEMPEGKDPDEILFDTKTGQVVAEGQERMAGILAASKPLLDERINESLKQASQGPEDRTQALKRIGGWLGRFQDSVGREVRAQQIQKQLGISTQLMHEVMGHNQSNSAASSASAKGRKVASEIKEERSSTRAVGTEIQTKMGPLDKTLLTGIAYGQDYPKIFVEARGNLPPDGNLSDLFEYLPAKEFVALLLSKPGYLEQLRNVPESLFHPDLDFQVRSTLTEALLASEPPVSSEDFRGALFRCMAKVWARFSQRIKKALAEAEAKKDSDLQVQLMKEYLDVQRKMKEFNCFYDEA
jgi:DNA primase